MSRLFAAAAVVLGCVTIATGSQITSAGVPSYGRRFTYQFNVMISDLPSRQIFGLRLIASFLSFKRYLLKTG